MLNTDVKNKVETSYAPAGKSLREKFSTPEDARYWAQIISFAPFLFQVSKSLRDLNILKTLENNKGVGFEELKQKTNLSDYALQVLLDAGESSGVLLEVDGSYELTAAGKFLSSDPLTNVNFNFTSDVCYEGLPSLTNSLKEENPEGLKIFGDWKTLYEGLTQLPQPAQKSWFEFDHYFSDDTFRKVFPILFREKPKSILDIGGNTGKFSLACMQFDPEVQLTVLDHPAQLKLAQKSFQEKDLIHRVECIGLNLLDHSIPFPKGHDIIWMSQFLDCFSKQDILKLMIRAREAMSENSSYYIMETFIDRQRFEGSRLCLDMTSLYFTCFANGNSRMYRATDFYELLDQAGLQVVEEFNSVRISHSIFKCKIKK